MKHAYLKFGPLLCVLALLSSCAGRASKLPRYAQVPAFAMTDTNGKPFQSSALSGKVWVADFIYANCPAACPLMSSKMKRFSTEVSPDVRLISISVDPDRDTPGVLKNFASHYGAPTPQWTFLTGSADTVHQLAYNTFHLGDLITKMEHSTKFALVDRKGVIRGYYSSLDPDSMAQLRRDTDALSDDKS